MLLAWFVEVMMPGPVTAASAMYLALLAVIVVLGGVAFFVARTVLRVN